MIQLLPSKLYTTTFIIFESKQRIDESKKRLDCVKDTHRATRRWRSVMAVRSPQSQIGDWNKKCYQISFLILFILCEPPVLLLWEMMISVWFWLGNATKNGNLPCPSYLRMELIMLVEENLLNDCQQVTFSHL